MFDLSAMASYYQAYPCSVNSSGAVSLEGYSSSLNNYYQTYLYTGGTAGTMNNITSAFTGTTVTTANAMNESGQIAAMGITSYPGYLYSGGLSGSLTTYQVGTYKTFSMGIDSLGDECGYYNLGSGSATYCPYVYAGGLTYALNRPATDVYTGGGAGRPGDEHQRTGRRFQHAR